MLTHLTDPDTRDAITAAMRDHANDHSGYGGLIDGVQFTAYTIRLPRRAGSPRPA